MKKRIWLESEINFIKNNYLTMTRDEISEKISCPLTVLSRKIKELGLKKHAKEPELEEKFNRLTIKEKILVSFGKQNKTMVKCLCDCGNYTEQRLTSVVSGKIVSCGCWKAEKARERTIERNYKHGKGNLEYRLYRIWSGIKNRCNPKYKEDKNYKSWAGKGIKMCDEWVENFENFENWSLQNGYADDLSIDRKNNDGNYEPLNCRWVTYYVQSHNKDNNINDIINAFGETKTPEEWIKDERCKISTVSTLRYRISAGWIPEIAITKVSERNKPSYEEGLIR